MASFPDARPDPDQLLESLRGDEERARVGKLRIYFGAGAGVGKTYAMLNAAQREQRAGREVLVGVIETHGRRETAELVAGLKQLPQREVPYRGRTLFEFDLDAALAAHPAVLLVDELAHSNAQGSRHPKRWQDVQELLDAGIDVWSALNVQHLESLNGTVGAITGIRVQETVPDTVLDRADEIILVDVTPDELLARLKAGKVYLPQQAERAAQNFFRKGNLIALREIALRRTAEHVEDDVRSYRIEQSQSGAGKPLASAAAWNTSGAILVCVGPHEGAEHAVRSAAQGNLAQGDQVALAEKVLGCTLRLLRQVDLAGLEARQQFVGGDVHQDDLIGAVQHGVGHGLLHADAGNGAHSAIEALQMLDIEGAQ